MVSTHSEASTTVPAAFRALPLHEVTAGNPLRFCVLARQRPDPVAGNFVLLRDLAEASVFLGCITDAEGRVWDWIELWVQNPDKLETSLRNMREHLGNHQLDDRWQKMSEAFKSVDPKNHLATGWEKQHPGPIFVDPSHSSGGVNGTAAGWKLCTDEALLQAAGLPGYAASLARYLHQPSEASGRLVPVTAGAPENDRTATVSTVLKNADHLLPFNPQCGFVMSRSFAPIPLEDYFDLLGGKAWSGVDPGDTPLPLGESYRTLENPEAVQQSGSYLFLGAHGKTGRLLETFHLKIQLITDVLKQVRTFVQRQQLPFLNLSGDSFRVKLGEAGAGLPILWTAQPLLARPSQAFALPIETSDFRYFLPAQSDSASIYIPSGSGQTVQGTGTARLRKVLPPERGLTVVEGTLVLQDKLTFSHNDLLWIRLNVQNKRIDLYGHLYSAEGLAQGEARFRTVQQKLPDTTVKALQAAEGVSFARTSFDVVPLMSSPADLYSLGVLAVRALLVNEKTSLAVALDEMMSLARQLGTEHQADVECKARLRGMIEKNTRWMDALGPHHLLWSGASRDEAASILPIELWSEALAAVSRLFPGMGPDSICRDFGDAPSLALETVFDQAVADFERLLVRSRSLIVIDWKYNREIHDVISSFMEKL